MKFVWSGLPILRLLPCSFPFNFKIYKSTYNHSAPIFLPQNFSQSNPKMQQIFCLLTC
jgi:hypothetical protein